MNRYDVIIIGGGPAGSATAITLATSGIKVLLLEEKQMPRGKLCGEFIAPESFPTLRRLGVLDRMMAAGAKRIERATLIVANGRSIDTSIANISACGTWAMSLSRLRFDQILFDRAREAGVECREGIAVKSCITRQSDRLVEALQLPDGTSISFCARVVIDASGRNSRLMLGRRERRAGKRGTRLYALKAHFAGISGIDDQVELHFFDQGYGGLARIENDLVNLCFIVDEQTLKRAGGAPDTVLEKSFMTGSVAGERMRGARIVGRWYSAGPLAFGRRRLARDGILAVGDASGMIDPFTGTGVQMALRTGELAAEAVVLAGGNAEDAIADYERRYDGEFGSRLKAATQLRRVAFSPRGARMVAGIMARMPTLADLILSTTRKTTNFPR